MTITNEDNMKLMARYPDRYFDLAIVDPPYGLDLANMNMGIGKSKKASKIQNRKWKPKNWDTATPDIKYFKELFRLSKNQIIWGGNYFNLPSFKHYIIWDKEIPNGLSFADCELAWTSFAKAPVLFRYSAYKDKKTKFHPTQKPVKLYEWLLMNYAKEGDKILDTHGGSMSIALAVHNMNSIEGMNLDLTLCELDKEYFEAGLKRLNNDIKQKTIFDKC